jgi:hypothetical protein
MQWKEAIVDYRSHLFKSNLTFWVVYVFTLQPIFFEEKFNEHRYKLFTMKSQCYLDSETQYAKCFLQKFNLALLHCHGLSLFILNKYGWFIIENKI